MCKGFLVGVLLVVMGACAVLLLGVMGASAVLLLGSKRLVCPLGV